MKNIRSRKGFTLIEMLVVIAIIAVLVAIVIPTVTAATDKAAAATDAANLRNVLGKMNAILMSGADNIGPAARNEETLESKLHPGAKLYVLYTRPGVIDVYFVDVDNDKYYGLDYLSQVAQGLTPTASTAEPVVADSTWYEIGVGEVAS